MESSLICLSKVPVLGSEYPLDDTIVNFGDVVAEDKETKKSSGDGNDEVGSGVVRNFTT